MIEFFRINKDFILELNGLIAENVVGEIEPEQPWLKHLDTNSE